jgi:peptidoglycan-associated lipoprotein
MNALKIFRAAALVVTLAVAAGCSSKSGTERADLGYGADSAAATTTGSGAQTGAARDGTAGAGSALGDSAAAGPQASQKNRTIYFDFDKDEVKAEYRDLVTAHARYLAANPKARVRLEGHTDERGSREYNIALGERRAQAVKQSLLLQGAGKDQAATVSYGEERPAATGSDEESWSLNRRVEIVYLP